MHAKAERQMGLWKNHGFKKASDLRPFVNQTSFLFTIQGGVFNCDYNSYDIVYAKRAQAYHHFFNFVSGSYRLPDLAFILDVADEAKESIECPIFTFQKEIGSHNILLPDVDFVESDFYRDFARWGLPDVTAYEHKKIRASFYGSTTGGGHISASSASTVPRIAASRFFSEHNGVDFFLSNLVQCDQAVADMLRVEGLTVPYLAWPSQLGQRFIISLDGNGAACSRVYIALASNSVLLKYSSKFELFYFEDMKPYQHFVPIEKHQDVLNTISVESDSPGYFHEVALEGADFAATRLSKEALALYMSELLKCYSDSS